VLASARLDGLPAERIEWREEIIAQWSAWVHTAKVSDEQQRAVLAILHKHQLAEIDERDGWVSQVVDDPSQPTEGRTTVRERVEAINAEVRPLLSDEQYRGWVFGVSPWAWPMLVERLIQPTE
jgi:hypothetical protein